MPTAAATPAGKQCANTGTVFHQSSQTLSSARGPRLSSCDYRDPDPSSLFQRTPLPPGHRETGLWFVCVQKKLKPAHLWAKSSQDKPGLLDWPKCEMLRTMKKDRRFQRCGCAHASKIPLLYHQSSARSGSCRYFLLSDCLNLSSVAVTEYHSLA